MKDFGIFSYHTAARTGADLPFSNIRQQVLPWQHFFLFLGYGGKKFLKKTCRVNDLILRKIRQ